MPELEPGANPRRRRRWSRLGLRGLMLLILIIGGGFGWLIHSARVRPARPHHPILARVTDPTPTPSPATHRPGLPEPLVALCCRCLAKDPRDRFLTARDLRLVLNQA